MPHCKKYVFFSSENLYTIILKVKEKNLQYLTGTFSTCLGGFNGILTFPMRTTLSTKICNHNLEFAFNVSRVRTQSSPN